MPHGMHLPSSPRRQTLDLQELDNLRGLGFQHVGFDGGGVRAEAVAEEVRGEDAIAEVGKVGYLVPEVVATGGEAVEEEDCASMGSVGRDEDVGVGQA